MLRNLNLLTQYQLVIVTPVITVGSDFTARHFHVCFAFSTSYTTDFEQIFQTIGRVRDLIDQHVHLYIGHNCVGRTLPTTLDKVKNWFKSKREANKWVECILLRRDSTENIMTKEGVSEWLLNVYFQNKLHSNMSAANYRRTVMYHLNEKKCKHSEVQYKEVEKKEFKARLKR